MLGQFSDVDEDKDERIGGGDGLSSRLLGLFYLFIFIFLT